MAVYDIMPYHGSPRTARVEHKQMGGSSTTGTAGTSFRVGEWGTFDTAAGDINVTADGATNWSNIHFIFAGNSDALIAKHKLTSGAATHNVTVPCWVIEDGVTYITRNLYNNSDTPVTPTVTMIGDTCGAWRDNTAVTSAAYTHRPAGQTGLRDSTDGVNGVFGIDQNGTGLIIVDVLDSNQESITRSAGTGVFVIFRKA